MIKTLRSFVCACLGLIVLVSSSHGSEPSKTEKFSQIIQSYAQKNLFNGNVLVAQKGKVIYKKSIGQADMEWGIANTADTKFRIGSVTKQFTALLIMRLKQSGKLKLEDKITTYLPWYRKDTGDQITIHQLLTHTAGIPNFTEDAKIMLDIENSGYSVKEVAQKYCSRDLEFAPGSKFKYNNSDYYLLGVIIEAVTGKTYEQVLKEEIFDPIGMKDTGIDKPSILLKKRATGYVFIEEKYYNAPFLDPESTTYAAGALYSTVGDLYLWQKALFSEKLLSKENLKIMLTPFLGKYAYGLYVNKFKPKGMNEEVTVIGHNGGIPGFSASLIRYVEDDITVILMDNTTVHKRGNLENISLDIFRCLKDLPT
ncbi:MAG: serine hydrolase domain-containing protein [Armatimonas sp.]